MTVETTNSTIRLTGDGVITSFPFTFKILDDDHMKVYIDEVLQVAGYTVNIDADGVGGTVDITPAPANGADILFLRQVPLTQGTVLSSEGVIDEEAITDMADLATMALQQLDEQNSRALTLPEALSGSDAELPAPEASNVIGWNATADAIQNYSVAELFAEIPTLGAGDVIGPAGATDKTLPLFDGATGKLLKQGPAIGTAEHFLKSQGAGQDPVFAQTVGGLGAGGGRTLPTSGALSGVYWHVGNWASAGALTADPGTRIFVIGTFTLTHALVVNDSGTGKLPADFLSPSSAHFGQGPGGGQCNGNNSSGGNGSGGGGGAHGGAGGVGGDGNTDGSGAKGGKVYFSKYWRGGSDGGYGGTGSGTGGAGGVGGDGGGAIEVFSTGAMTISGSGAINIDGGLGGNGVAGSTGVSGGGGGGAGGYGAIGSQTSVTISATLGVTARGGQGGSSTTGSGGVGAGGGGGRVWIVAPSITISGTTSVAGGAVGGTGRTTGSSAGSTGVLTQVTATPNFLTGWI